MTEWKLIKRISSRWQLRPLIIVPICVHLSVLWSSFRHNAHHRIHITYWKRNMSLLKRRDTLFRPLLHLEVSRDDERRTDVRTHYIPRSRLLWSSSVGSRECHTTKPINDYIKQSAVSLNSLTFYASFNLTYKHHSWSTNRYSLPRVFVSPYTYTWCVLSHLVSSYQKLLLSVSAHDLSHFYTISYKIF